MHIHELTRTEGLLKPGKRLGRGHGSGKGNYSGKGCKGQKARKSGGVPPRFEGGQTPLFMRLPKLRGFKRPQGLKAVQTVTLFMLESSKAIADVVTKETLVAAGCIHSVDAPVKILATGTLSKKLQCSGIEFYSSNARAAIEQAGGSCA